MEIRNIASPIESSGRKVYGYAIRFGESSVTLYHEKRRLFFKEYISRDAISQDILDSSDIFAFYNHDQSKVLARNGIANTLKLEYRDDGIYYEFDAPNTEVGNELLEHINRHEMYGNSFGFLLADDGSDEVWTRDSNGDWIREITNLRHLVEISPVFAPAYETTTISKRAIDILEDEKYNNEDMNKDELKIRAMEDEEEKKEVEEQEEQSEEQKPDEEERSEDENTEEEEKSADEEPSEEKDDEDPKEEERQKTTKINRSKNIEKRKMKEVKYSLINAIRNAKDHKVDAITEAVNELGRKNLRDSNLGAGGSIFIPVGEKLNNRATVTVEAEGEDIVVTDFLNILEPLRTKNVLVNSGARFLTGLKGDLQIPKMTEENVFWEGETTESKDGAGTFSHIKMQPRRIAAWVNVSNQLLVQDTLNAEALIREDLVKALNAKLESTILGEAAADGDKPAGIFNGVTPVQVSSFRDLCDLEAKVEESCFYGDMKYILNPHAKAALRAMPKSSKMTQLVIDQATIDGTPFDSTNHIAENKLAYGSWENLYIGQWGGIELKIDDTTLFTSATTRVMINAWFDYAVVRDGAIVYGEIVEDGSEG